MGKEPKLSARLRVIAELVRPGAVLADVGTDHALLPVWLRLQERVTHAFAADIRVGPLQSARRTIAEYGADEIETVLCDGLTAPELRAATDIVIAGMGGELIADILDRAPFVRDAERQLILQPMSRDAHLRRYLCENGFAILTERAVSDRGFPYTVMQVHYTGTSQTPPPLFEQIGLLAEERSPEAMEFIRRRIKLLEKRRDGLRTAGRDADEVRELDVLIRQMEGMIQP